MRVEHHTLTCLPRTGTVVFAIRTYITSLKQIKSEGLGPLLAESCESMPEKFGFYKNRPTWGEKICSWLKDEDTQARHQLEKTETTAGVCPFSGTLTPEAICPIKP